MNGSTPTQFQRIDQALAGLFRALIWIGGFGLAGVWLASLGHVLLSIR